MIKKLFTIFTLTAFLPLLTISQDDPGSMIKVKNAVYFDKTPPLRNMKIVLPGERDRSWKDQIIQNEERDESALFSNFTPPEKDLALQSDYGSRQTEGPIQSFPG